MRTPARLIAVVAALAASVALGACGSDDDSSTTASTGTQAAGSADAFPVSIEHKFGTTDIEEQPERVVVVGYTEQDMVYALGVEPVAVRDFFGGYDWRERPWAADVAGEVPEVLGAEEIEFEKVAAQRPDVILALNSGITKEDYERLSKIAPTIAQSGDFVDYGMPWQDQTRMIGQALGKEAEAEQVVSDLEAKFEQAKEEHPEFVGATAILAYGGPDGYGAYATQDTRSRFFTNLGFEMPAKVDELAGDSFYTEFSQEQFRLMDQDVVVMFGSESDVKDNPVFGRLDAVKEDRVIYLDLTDDFSGALGFASPLSFDYLIDEASPALAAALDEDPSTKVPQPE